MINNLCSQSRIKNQGSRIKDQESRIKDQDEDQRTFQFLILFKLFKEQLCLINEKHEK